jgi:hypothetical protein
LDTKLIFTLQTFLGVYVHTLYVNRHELNDTSTDAWQKQVKGHRKEGAEYNEEKLHAFENKSIQEQGV